MRIGQFELLEVVGRGGMGTVYRSRHTDSGAIFAVKVMAQDMASDPLLLRRFEQEFTTANRLRHPNIVQGLSFGVEDGKPYLVMEYVDGQNLRQCVKDQGPLPEAEALRVTGQVAGALELAHQQRLIHRDVKPENVLLTHDGQAKLTDLGLIKDIDSGTNLTRTWTTLGTAAFMAPEQYEDAKHANVRCDVYGLAATLYFLLTGVAPFQGRGNLTILRKKLQNDFQPPRRIVPSLEEHVDRAICVALDADPQHRPASCREFADLLETATPAPGGKADTTAADGKREPLAGDERRAAPRYACDLEAACGSPATSDQQWQARVLDISRTGIQLQLTRRFEHRAVLRVAVLNEIAEPIADWLVQVRWVQEVGTGRWSIGCALDRELNDYELDTMLEHIPPTVVIQERLK